MRVLAVLALPLIIGCGLSVGLVLKSPVVDRCNAAGLKGCPELAEGAIAYLDGNKDEAKQKILLAAAQNAPGNLRTFATALRGLKSIPGAAEQAGPLFEIADLLAWQANRSQGAIEARVGPAAGGVPALAADPTLSSAAPRRAPPGGVPASWTSLPGSPSTRAPVAFEPDVYLPERAMTADSDLSRIDGGTITFSIAVDAKIPCADAAVGGAGLCMKIMDGAFIVTDLQVAPGCGRDLFITIGSGASAGPRWSLSSPLAAPLGVHGGRLVVRAGEALLFGSGIEPLKHARGEGRCVLTWGGFKPYDAN